MMTLTMLSQKGGAGEVHLALHLLDPQGSLASWGAKRAEPPPDVEAVHPFQPSPTESQNTQTV